MWYSVLLKKWYYYNECSTCYFQGTQDTKYLGDCKRRFKKLICIIRRSDQSNYLEWPLTTDLIITYSKFGGCFGTWEWVSAGLFYQQESCQQSVKCCTNVDRLLCRQIDPTHLVPSFWCELLLLFPLFSFVSNNVYFVFLCLEL